MAKALGGFQYQRVSISAEVRTELHSRRDQGKAPKASTKGDDRKPLQDLGNELRQKNGADHWAKKAVEKADQSLNGLAVFDGIRNSKELEFLRNAFPNFLLITVWCPQKIRFDRVKDEYGGDWAVFEEDDKRDGNEEFEYGQQVQLCVDRADIVLRNEESHTPEVAAITYLKNKIEQYILLLTGKEVRPPHHDEVAMAIAYTSALRSLCLKRTVGASITSVNGVLVSSGYNENPDPMFPCIKAFGYCYKDAQLREHIEIMVSRNPECPNKKCKAPLKGLESLHDGFKCNACNYSLVRAYAPDRGMSRCTAVHAEMAAVLNANGEDLRDKVLYTTTFPCAQCARQIAYVGIKKVVYVEPYPDPDSERFMRENCKITLQMFEGVKARAYERVFNNVRAQNEKKYSLPT
ncbi:MAG TPA: deaminase [Nitrospiraceae bacterium]|nr:deaminase [Nitrospiraceae bacterium]